LYFVGLACLLGGILTQLSSPARRVVPAMVRSAGLMLVSGLGLYAVDDGGRHHGPPGSKMAVKVGALMVAPLYRRVRRVTRDPGHPP
jgi:hypothetical protein